MESIDLLANFGFPIAAFILVLQMYREERDERRDEREAWLEALQEHTAILRDLKRDVRHVATDGGEDTNE